MTEHRTRELLESTAVLTVTPTETAPETLPAEPDTWSPPDPLTRDLPYGRSPGYRNLDHVRHYFFGADFGEARLRTILRTARRHDDQAVEETAVYLDEASDLTDVDWQALYRRFGAGHGRVIEPAEAARLNAKFLRGLDERPSDLLRRAVRDAETCEADRTYRIEMRCWHTPSPDGRTAVCLAGSVIAQSLGVPADTRCDPAHFQAAGELTPLGNQLAMINCARVWISGEAARNPTGYTAAFASVHKDAFPRLKFDRNLTSVLARHCGTAPPYEADPARHKAGLLALADDLERIGA